MTEQSGFNDDDLSVSRETGKIRYGFPYPPQFHPNYKNGLPSV